MVANAKSQGHTIKTILSDNGGEFINENVKKILKANGINHRVTAPYTPQQNGNAERENRTIVEMARTFKYSNKDIKFPDETVSGCASIKTRREVNNEPSKTNSNITQIKLELEDQEEDHDSTCEDFEGFEDAQQDEEVQMDDDSIAV
ncbi:Retrovirus-related Pol polyprotein from transposon TNT 1-94 [Eumeta japonica]|uniref:Retrovirus-related Pol polyprotein from transposon TNT 1-94 n=1 Tax=Eumeta variegata TaxID=151549 RepID=A0A4C1TDZ3_EUMVA|nr:Retrovirus-related Pol polyprotein from transposon TNT 1-94 [Eumeta japonica]